MLKSLSLVNFTAFSKETLDFGKNLSVIIGENGTGKSHVLKAAYTGIAANASRGNNSNGSMKEAKLELLIADKLQGVFRPDNLSKLVRQQGRVKKGLLTYKFYDEMLDLSFSVSSSSESEVDVNQMPMRRIEKSPIFFPTRELLTIYPGFVSLYDTTHLSFEETWRDTCILLGAPLAKGARETIISKMLEPIEEVLGGTIVLDSAGRFYLETASGKMEMHLVAEGWRKLAMVARLIATGALLENGYLFWDEPEANLNPAIVKLVAKVILELCRNGVQVFIATHSLFLMRELYILQQDQPHELDVRYFGLHAKMNSVTIKQGPSLEDIGDIAALDEELEQSDRYMKLEMESSNDNNV